MLRASSGGTRIFVLVSAVLLVTLAQSPNAALQTQQTFNPKLPTIFVVGDSTANNHANGALGWGDPFVAYFDLAKVNVLNRARAGRSSRTFVTEGLWDKVLSELKRGDVVLIQFGHNDGGPINDASRARGSLPGVGEETEEIDNLLTKQHEVVHTYGWYLRKLIGETRAKGAVPVLLSLTVRNIWQDGRVERGSGRFGQWAAEVAESQHVEFIDVTAIIANRYEQLGQERVQALFGPDHTHTSAAGAELNAELVVAGLKTLKHCEPCIHLSSKGKAVERYQPAPANLSRATVAVWPDGKMPGHGADEPEQDRPPQGDYVQRITNVSHPTLTLFPVLKKDAPAMIVCPGGAYNYVVHDKEGTDIAAWLNSNGFTALVLKYRVPQNREGALQDLQRAIRLARAHAAEWNIDPKRLGVMGFSAGGNLAAKASTQFDLRSYTPIDAVDRRSCRPDFAVLVYPAYLEVEGQIAPDLNLKAKIPPTLIVSTEDDNRFVMGCKIYRAALEAAKIPNEFLLYPDGGHGYGLRSDKAVRVWPQATLAWLHKIGIR